MKTIRGALTAGVLASLFVVFAVCASALYLYVRYALTREFDHSLFGKARAFASLSNRGAEDLEGRLVALSGLPPAVQETVGRELQGAPLSEVEQVTRDGRLFYKIETSRQGMESEFLVSGAGQYLGVVDEFDFAFYEAALPEFQPSPDAEYYQVWDEDEEPVTKSPSLGAANLVLPDGATSVPRTFNLALPDGRRGRAALLAFRPRGKGGASSGETDGSEELVLVMARSRAGLDQALRVVGTGLIGAFLLIGVCSTLAVRWFVARGLETLGEVAAQAATIDEASLAHRFPVTGVPAEVMPICLRLNELLHRLQNAFEREQRFTADAAHELRTPLAELHLLAEVGLRASLQAAATKDFAQHFRDALAIAEQMERLVAALLTLARCQSGLQVVLMQPTGLVELVRQSWMPFQQETQFRNLALSFRLDPDAEIETDPALLGPVLGNLFSNAVAYSPDQGEIVVEMSHDPQGLYLHVTNAAEHLEPADLEHLFEPFWRKDKARSDSSHSGVGLSIIAAFAGLLGVHVVAALPAPGKFRVTLGPFHKLHSTRDTA